MNSAARLASESSEISSSSLDPVSKCMLDKQMKLPDFQDMRWLRSNCLNRSFDRSQCRISVRLSSLNCNSIQLLSRQRCSWKYAMAPGASLTSSWDQDGHSMDCSRYNRLTWIVRTSYNWAQFVNKYIIYYNIIYESWDNTSMSLSKASEAEICWDETLHILHVLLQKQAGLVPSSWNSSTAWQPLIPVTLANPAIRKKAPHSYATPQIPLPKEQSEALLWWPALRVRGQVSDIWATGTIQ